MFKNIPLADLAESPTNPRKRYDEKQMEELAESIREHGVLQPILVREVRSEAPTAAAEPWEIIAGSRRFRAAKLAGLEEIPARVVEMGDDEVLEVQIVENLQRSEVHPLDEAAGFAALAEHMKHTIVAAKVGKSEGYVLRRLKLNELVEGAKAAFYNGRMTLGHAESLARLRTEDQVEALETYWDGETTIPTVVQFKGWIERSLLLDLDGAPFRREDAKLVPAAGSCMNCPKRSGAQPALFEDLDGRNLCLDRACFETKMTAHWEQQRKLVAKKAKTAAVLVAEVNGKLPAGTLLPYQWDEAEEGEEGAVAGLVVASYNDERVGTTLWVIERPEHGVGDDDEEELTPDEKEEREEQRREAERQAKERAEKECEKAEIERAVLQRALKEAVHLAAKEVSAPRVVYDTLFENTVNACNLDDDELGDLTGVQWTDRRPAVPLSNAQKVAVVLFEAHSHNCGPYGDKKLLEGFLAAFDVDVKAIRAAVKKERKAAARRGDE